MSDPVGVAAVREFLGVLELSTYRAFVATAAGAVILFAIKNPWYSLDFGDFVSGPIGLLSMIIGSTNLAVRAGYNVREHFGAKIVATRAREDEAARLVQHVNDLMLSLEALPALEFGQLYWILHNGTRRVELPDGPIGLINKGLVNMVIRGRTSYVEVNGLIWMLRDRFINACEPIVRPSAYPTYTYSDVNTRVVTQLMKNFVQNDEVRAAINASQGRVPQQGASREYNSGT